MTSHHALCLQHVDLLFSEGIDLGRGGDIPHRVVFKEACHVSILSFPRCGSLDSQDVDSSGILCGILRDP